MSHVTLPLPCSRCHESSHQAGQHTTVASTHTQGGVRASDVQTRQTNHLPQIPSFIPLEPDPAALRSRSVPDVRVVGPDDYLWGLQVSVDSQQRRGHVLISSVPTRLYDGYGGYVLVLIHLLSDADSDMHTTTTTSVHNGGS